MKLSRRILLASSVAVATACIGAQAATPAWPAKPVRVVVGFSAGGPTDVVARAFAQYAAKSLGENFIVENKPGANTILAAEAVATAPADGYTLLFGATNHTMIPALYGDRVKFDAVRSFAPVCTVANSPTVLVVGPAMQAKTLAQFLQQVRSEPGKRTFASPGTGSSGHFAGVEFGRLAGVRMNHIPYKGAAPAVTDLMAGQVDSSFATLGSVLPQVSSGKLTALAVASPKRSVLLPNVPTFEESGIKGFSADAWYGLLAPAGTPKAVLDKLTQVAQKFSADAGTTATLGGMGMDPLSECGATFGARLQRETAASIKLARELNLKAE